MSDLLPAEAVRESIAALIKAQHPDWSNDGFICLSDLNRFRNQYVEQEVKAEKGELSALEMEVVQSIKEQELLSRDVDLEYEETLKLGERWADRLRSRHD
jgi:hypothetical protein